MAFAKKCDRCGGLYEMYPASGNKNHEDYINGITTASISEERRFYNIDLIDLCPKCLEELAEWLNTDNKTFIPLKKIQRKIVSKEVYPSEEKEKESGDEDA